MPVGLERAESANPKTMNPASLPSHRLPSEQRIPGKADSATDYRALHPQWYAITAPPKGNFRPMREWEPMQANIITYSDYLQADAAVSQTIVDIAAASLEIGEVWVVYESDIAKSDFISKVGGVGVSDAILDSQVKYFNIANDAIWQVDYGPLSLIDQDSHAIAFADFRYYHPRVHDDAVPTRLGNLLGVTTYRSPFDFEGGNFQADGEEFCYFSERVYTYTGLSFDEVEAIMQTYLGCKKAVALKDITNDATGHIDNFFKLGGKHVAFVGDYTAVADSTNKVRMDDNAALLEGLEFSDGSGGLTVYRIPMPHPKQGVPRTFINSTLFVSADGAEKANLWPTYAADKDLEAEALAVWQEGLPGWDHVGIDSDQISLLSGAVHSVTRTVPAFPLGKWVADGECVDGACIGEEGAYSGVCIPPSEDKPGCWGPEWECLCNVCEGTGCGIPAACGNGACDEGENCFSCAKDCGCIMPESCDFAGGQCTCISSCAGKECGNDGCGGSCGSCPSGVYCDDGQCDAPCPMDFCDEYPYHYVDIPNYLIDLHETTVGSYLACVVEGGCTEPLQVLDGCNWGAEKEDYPVNCVSWYQAQQYCEWAGRRLCSEAEWEKGARGTEGLKYPWGNAQATCEKAVMVESGQSGCGLEETWPVASKQAGQGQWGVHDMAGNVAEWVQDWYAADCYQLISSGASVGPAEGVKKVVRGGSFADGGPKLRSSERSAYFPSFSGPEIGVRCCDTP